MLAHASEATGAKCNSQHQYDLSVLTLQRIAAKLGPTGGVEDWHRQPLSQQGTPDKKSARSTDTSPAGSQAPARKLWISRGNLNINLADLVSDQSAARPLQWPTNTGFYALQPTLFSS